MSFLILRCPVLISTSTNTTTLEITYNRCTDYEKLPKKPTLLVEKGFLQCGPSTLPCGLLMRFLNYPKPSPGLNSYGVFLVNWQGGAKELGTCFVMRYGLHNFAYSKLANLFLDFLVCFIDNVECLWIYATLGSNDWFSVLHWIRISHRFVRGLCNSHRTHIFNNL